MYKIYKFFEAKYGYNSKTEFINSLFCVLFNPIKFLTFTFSYLINIIKGKKIIIITFSIPQHADAIQNIPNLLAQSNAKVYIFLEWDTKLNPKYELKSKLPVYKDCWRFLSFTYAHCIITSINVKQIYFPNKAKRIHYFHSIASLNAYSKGAFYSFDTFITIGPHLNTELKQYFKNEKIKKQRIIIPGGYPKIDFMNKKVKSVSTNLVNKKRTPTIIYCPTLYSNNVKLKQVSSVKDFGFQIIENLLDNGFNVIFRPHPYNIKNNDISETIKKIDNSFSENKNFKFDYSSSYYESYIESDLMLSDISGTAFTYFFGYNRPVIFYDMGIEEIGVHYTKRNLVGELVSNVYDINKKITLLLNDKQFVSNKLEKAKEELIYNFGTSEAIISKEIIAMLDGNINDNWEVI